MSVIIKIIRNNHSILIAYFELIAGVILLAHEIRDFVTLPATNEAWETISYFTYKENTYCLLYLWTILLFAGSSFWINLKLHWTLNQVFLMTLIVAIISRPDFFLPWYLDSSIFIILFAISLLFVWLEVRMYRKSYLKKMGINWEMKRFSIILGFVSWVIYFMLDIV